jgi:hypothetical protein
MTAKTVSQTVKLICPECQRQNEPERIYCHDCGARLDRSSLARVAPKIEAPEATQRRLKRLLDPTRARIKYLFFRVCKTILGSAAVAGVILMVLPPEVPEKPKAPELVQITMEIENSLALHSTAPIQYSETQVNGYLTSNLRSKKAALSKVLQFEGAIIKFDEKVVRLSVERSLFGFSVYTTTSYRVALQNGTLTAANQGGKIGRLYVPPMLMEFGGVLFQDIFSALDRDKKLVSKMGSIEFHPQQVVLIPKQKE